MGLVQHARCVTGARLLCGALPNPGLCLVTALGCRCLRSVMHSAEMSISPNIPELADECKDEVGAVARKAAREERGGRWWRAAGVHPLPPSPRTHAVHNQTMLDNLHVRARGMRGRVSSYPSQAPCPLPTHVSAQPQALPLPSRACLPAGRSIMHAGAPAARQAGGRRAARPAAAEHVRTRHCRALRQRDGWHARAGVSHAMSSAPAVAALQPQSATCPYFRCWPGTACGVQAGSFPSPASVPSLCLSAQASWALVHLVCACVSPRAAPAM